MGYASAHATSSNGHYVYADITWDDNLKVTVNLINVNAGWCIKIRGTSTIKCSGSMSNRTSTFYADYDGQEFTLQVYDLVEESYVNNGNPVFTVTNSSGGGDSGGNPGGDSGGGDYVGANTMYINPGEGTKITVYRTWSDNEANRRHYLAKDVTEPTTVVIYYPNDRFHIMAEALPGYEIDYYDDFYGDSFPYYTDNLSKFWTDDYGGAWRYQPMSDLSISIDATATRIHGVHIDDGTNFNPYYCYIDNGKSNPETISKNCEIVGHKSFYAYPGFLENIYSNNEYNMNLTEYASAYYDVDYDTPVNYAYVLAFKVPRYVTHPVNFTIDIQANEGISGFIKGENPTMNYALCSSDFNYPMYTKAVGELGENGYSDAFEIVHGTFLLNDKYKNDTNKIIINEVFINPKDEIYYLFIWDDERIPFYTDECPIAFDSASDHTVTCTYVENQFDLYIPYIDNGTSWEQL